jgi:hypothetical protein
VEKAEGRGQRGEWGDGRMTWLGWELKEMRPRLLVGI